MDNPPQEGPAVADRPTDLATTSKSRKANSARKAEVVARKHSEEATESAASEQKKAERVITEAELGELRQWRLLKCRLEAAAKEGLEQRQKLATELAEAKGSLEDIGQLLAEYTEK